MRHLEEWANPRTIVILTLLLLGALWSVLIVSAVSTRQESIAATGEVLQRMALSVEEQTRQQFRLVDTFLASCAHWMQGNPDRDPHSDPAFRKLIEGLRTRTGASIDFYLLAADGRVFDVLSKTRGTPAYLTDQHFLHSALASAGLFIGGPLREPWSSHAGLPIARSLQTPTHGIRSLLAVIDLATLSATYEEQRQKPGGAITLLKRDGIVLVHAPQPELLPGQSMLSAKLFNEDLAKRPRALLDEQAGKLARRLIGYSAMPDFPLLIVVSENYDDALAPWLRQTVWVVLLAVGITVPLAVVAYRSLRLLQVLAGREAELQHLATTDRLTGTRSRQHFVAILEKELARTLDQQSPLTVLLFGIDFFKRINDGYGHAVGDQVLIAFAEVATRCLRARDVLGRLGDGEFSMLLPDTNAGEAIQIAERVRSEIARISIPTENGTVRFTASVGVSQTLTTDRSTDELLTRVAQALYDAKVGGHDRVVLV